METKEMNVRGLDGSRYETLRAEVATIEPQGVLCASGSMGFGFDDMGGSAL